MKAKHKQKELLHHEDTLITRTLDHLGQKTREKRETKEQFIQQGQKHLTKTNDKDKNI